MLTGAEIGAFCADGFVAVRGAVPATVAAQCRDQIWSELAARGVHRDDPSTWTDPVVRINCPEGGPFAAAGTVPRLWQCYDQLIGPGRWWRRDGVGGTIPVRFPSPADPGRCPRMIAQPGVALFGEFALSPQPGAPSAPVEQAILDGLAQAGISADESQQPEPSPYT